MLTQFKIDNFKSLVDFSLPEGDESLTNFVCLIGLNGSGKSTVLQAIDFVAHLAVGDIGKWLTHRGWEKSELLSKGTKKRNINFSMRFTEEALGELVWTGSYNNQQGRCTREELAYTPPSSDVSGVLPSASVTYTFESGVLKEASGPDGAGWKREILTDFSGSVFNKVRLPTSGSDPLNKRVITLLRYFLQGVKSLELLSPQSMRKSSKGAVDVGAGGETLAAFIHGLPAAEKKEFFTELSKFYPRLERAASRSGKYGWKRFFVSEKYDSSVDLDARHVNDGLLRVAAIIAQTVATDSREDDGNPDQKEYQFVLLDEIENGMNPEVVERLMKYLLGVRQQVFVTTHSPLILNYLPDDVARASVFLVYRRADGASRAQRFFEIQEVADRLEMMGPGEAFLDVRLERLSTKLSRVQ